MTLRFTGELYVMRMKNAAKIEEELTSKFKTDMNNLTNFDSSTQNLKNLHFNGVPLTRVYNV